MFEDLIFLSASPYAGGGTVEGSAFKGSDAWAKPGKEMKRLTSERDMRRNVFMKTILVLYNKSRVH